VSITLLDASLIVLNSELPPLSALPIQLLAVLDILIGIEAELVADAVVVALTPLVANGFTFEV